MPYFKRHKFDLKNTLETLTVSLVSGKNCIYFAPDLEKQYLNILNTAHNMFVLNGPRSVSLDDISSNLNISKKTIYKYFKGKEDLVHQVVHFHLTRDIEDYLSIIKVESNPIKQLIRIIDLTHEHLKGMSKCLIFDIRKYYPKVFVLINKYKQNTIKDTLLTNLKKGKEEGYYLQETDDKKTIHFHMLLLDSIFGDEEHAYPEKDEVIYLIIWYLLRAISTEKGLNYINQQKEFKNNVFKH